MKFNWFLAILFLYTTTVVSCQDSYLLCKSNPTWTTILRRQDGSEDFYRNWADYQEGFGNQPDGEFFIGLNKLHEMTTERSHELIVFLKDWKNEMRYAHYDHFRIGGEDEKYAITVLGKYNGDAGDSLTEHNGMQFSTYDQDNDVDDRNCAITLQGAWWFKGCRYSHLNGPYRKDDEYYQPGVSWFHWKNIHEYSFTFAEMKIRPKYH